MTDAWKPLWGWLDQADNDPIAGKLMVEKLLCRMTGFNTLASTPPIPFLPETLPATRLSKTAQSSLSKAFGAEGFSIDPEHRARLSQGQSYPDQLNRRAGFVSNPADAVVRPASADEAGLLLALAVKHGFSVVAAGGATNVVGAFAAQKDRRPRVVVDMTAMKTVIEISEMDHTVTAQAGILLPELEDQLSRHGLTLGHFPQSYLGATLGGSIACNGAGQRSDGYGRISDNLLSAELATPVGIWTTESIRHAAAGPWLGALVAGSEGLFGLICSARLRVHAKPDAIEDRGWFLPSFEAACEAVRRLAQSGHSMSMLRISDEDETKFLSQFRLAMAGRARTSLLEQMVLKLRRAPQRPVLVIAGYEGTRQGLRPAFQQVADVLKQAGGVSLGARPGHSWRKGRYALPYLRESLMRRGLGVDTFETAVPWSQVRAMRVAVCDILRETVASTIGIGPGKPAVMCHLSHSYPEGACLYFTAIFPRNSDALSQWRVIKAQVLSCISENGGTASHHHGAGADHADQARIEKGVLALSILKAVKQQLDPNNVLISGAGAMLD